MLSLLQIKRSPSREDAALDELDDADEEGDLSVGGKGDRADL